MAIDSYSELQSAVASFLHRTDISAEIKDFIRLAEADLQVRAILPQWDTSATVSMTSGVGTLPTDIHHIESVGYGAGDYTLDHRPAAQFENAAVAAETGEPAYYTVRGVSLYCYPLYTGDLTLYYAARFTRLSDSATTNSLLTLFPDVYLHGALYHACLWDDNDAGLQKYKAMFEEGVGRVKRYMNEFKYPDGLTMRVA